MTYFFCKLIPPRPSFAVDMTADEREIMIKHGAYWRAGLDGAGVIAFGPVGDPKGVFGMGLLGVQTEADAKEFTGMDPAIRSGREFKYEIYPMANLVFQTAR